MAKILWMSPYSLHDISSGASIHSRYILESLQKVGFEVWSFSSFVFDRPYGGSSTFGDIKTLFETHSDTRIFNLDDRGIHYIYVKCKTTTEMMRTSAEQDDFYEAFCDVLDLYKPDIVIGYGTGMDSYTCFAEAKRRGIGTVYLLFNGKHGHFTFPNIDLVLTDSQMTATLYANRDQMNCVPIGQFIDPEYVIAKKREPTYITLVNPDFGKGVSIFAKLAKVCQTELPELQFLTINNRANFADKVIRLYEIDEKGEKVYPFTAQDFPNVFMSEATHDMRLIYEKAKVVMVPSLFYESWGRIASEAILNDIPVIGNDIGGIKDAIGAGGITITPSPRLINNPMLVPTDAEIRPYVDALKRVITEDFSEGINKTKESINLPRLTQHLVNVLTPLINHQDRLRAHTFENI